MDNEKLFGVGVFSFLSQATSFCFNEPRTYSLVILSRYLLIVYLTKLSIA
jgi:hypothetical protein